MAKKWQLKDPLFSMFVLFYIEVGMRVIKIRMQICLIVIFLFISLV